MQALNIVNDGSIMRARFPFIWFTTPTATLNDILDGSQTTYEAMTYPQPAEIEIPPNEFLWARLSVVRTGSTFALNAVTGRNVLVKSDIGSLQFGAGGSDPIQINGQPYRDEAISSLDSGYTTPRIFPASGLRRIGFTRMSTRVAVDLAALQTTPVCSFSGTNPATGFISTQWTVTLSNDLEKLISMP